MPCGYQATPKQPTGLVGVSDGDNLDYEFPVSGLCPLLSTIQVQDLASCRFLVNVCGMKEETKAWMDR